MTAGFTSWQKVPHQVTSDQTYTKIIYTYLSLYIDPLSLALICQININCFIRKYIFICFWTFISQNKTEVIPYRSNTAI